MLGALGRKTLVQWLALSDGAAALITGLEFSAGLHPLWVGRGGCLDIWGGSKTSFEEAKDGQ